MDAFSQYSAYTTISYLPVALRMKRSFNLAHFPSHFVYLNSAEKIRQISQKLKLQIQRTFPPTLKSFAN